LKIKLKKNKNLKMATKDWKKIVAPINRTFYLSNKTKQKIFMKKSLSKGYIIFTNGKILKV